MQKLRKCCEDYDMDGVDKAMSELESMRYVADAGLVAWLREKVNITDFTSIALRLEE